MGQVTQHTALAVVFCLRCSGYSSGGEEGNGSPSRLIPETAIGALTTLQQLQGARLQVTMLPGNRAEGGCMAGWLHGRGLWYGCKAEGGRGWLRGTWGRYPGRGMWGRYRGRGMWGRYPGRGTVQSGRHSVPFMYGHSTCSGCV